MSVALVIVFNHRYDRNIEVLEDLYRGRFRHIYHLVPFYDGEKENVIPVYGNSYYYSTYIAQGLKSFFKTEYTSFCFIADDMLLNPSVNEGNLHEYLGIKGNDCFIPEIKSMHEVFNWWHTHNAAHYKPQRWGVEVSNEIPSYEEALAAFQMHKLELKPLTCKQVFEPETLKQKALRIAKVTLRRQKARLDHYPLNYPLVGAFSDFVLVSNNAIKKFAHYCGAFAALELFVELAVPTALVLSAASIKSEAALAHKGKYLWTREETHELLDLYNKNLTRLFMDFPPGLLFIHPVKLSQWTFDKPGLPGTG